MPSMWVFDEASFGEIVKGKPMSHLQPPEPQPSINSARTTYGRSREGQPSLPLQQQNPQQPQYPQYQPQPQPQYSQESQTSQYLQGPEYLQDLQPQSPQNPLYQPHLQTTRTTQNPQQLSYPDQPQSPSTQITQNPQQLSYPLQPQSTRTTQNPQQLSYPAQMPLAYKQKLTYPPHQKQQPYPESSPKKKYSEWIFPGEITRAGSS